MAKMKPRRRRLSLLALMGGWDGVCHWCGCRILIYVDAIHEYHVVNFEKERITYRDGDGNNVVVQVATIDHLAPQREGGSDHLGNLQASCAPCNRRRDLLMPFTPPPPAPPPPTTFPALADHLRRGGWHEGVPCWLEAAVALDRQFVAAMNCLVCGHTENAVRVFYQPYPRELKYRVFAVCVNCGNVA